MLPSIVRVIVSNVNMVVLHRLLALKALCETRIDRGLYQVVDDAIKPPRLPKGAKEQGGRGAKRPAPRTLEDFRLKPLGRDSSGFVFYWLDLGAAGRSLHPLALCCHHMAHLLGLSSSASQHMKTLG